MDRLTSNKSVSEMSMYELAHNSCYAEDGNARYRDYETDIDAREFAIKLLENYADIPNDFTCDEDLDDFISDFLPDFLQYGTDCITGLIAVFYQHIWAMADLRERLKEYEDLEEQGKLLKAPCTVGDTVYYIAPKRRNYEELKVIFFNAFSENEIYMRCDSVKSPHISYGEIDVDEIGKTVFLTREEAEAALKEL